jgi:hypothetical protein
MEDDANRWTATRKAALVLEILRGETNLAEATRAGTGWTGVDPQPARCLRLQRADPAYVPERADPAEFR